jgi:ubiquitin carboxyl-terminal hydrolase 25
MEVLYKMMYAIKAEGEDANGFQVDRIREMFFAKKLQTYMNKDAEEKEEEQPTQNVSLASRPQNVYELLDSDMDPSDVVLDGKATARYATFTKLPPILQICFGRQGYNKDEGKAFMYKQHVQLDDVIYLDRYMPDDGRGILDRRQNTWWLKGELRKLREKREALSDPKAGVDAADTMDAMWQWVEDVGNEINIEELDTDTPDETASPSGSKSDLIKNGLKQQSRRFRAELECLDKRIVETEEKIRSQFADLTEKPYRLAAVFVHRGSTRAGHYWVYIRDFEADVWRKYEDREVHEVRDPSVIFKETDPEVEGAPYVLVYVDDSRKKEMFQAVCRSSPDATANEPTSPLDTEMEDYIPRQVQRAESMGEISQTPILGQFREGEGLGMGGYDGADDDVIDGVEPPANHPAQRPF